ncbi:uncharacterized protein LOC132264396 [Phlebotomus argentipes]|uniref:uncharacterized protein LOC132264396 n=1 Tax=Phlebotomus argentipes TaxID=94469 RepID=UPI002892E1D8|nr:uncharacterized protein LOC132264396 [Phlebotomus argentipes]
MSCVKIRVSSVSTIQLMMLLNILRSGFAVLSELETPEREAFLRPRHFNPHPFEATNGIDRSRLDREIQPASTSIFNQGPIQFPPTNQDTPGRPNNHPYAAVALRNRQKGLQRFAGIVSEVFIFILLRRFTTPPVFYALPRQDNNILPTYITLSRHGKKFYPGPQQRLDYEDNIYDDYSSQKKNFAFSYSVKDAASGDDFSHTQQQKDGAVSGSYKVHLPDGRTQIVRYRADDNGYHADVSYNEDKVLPALPAPRPTFNYLKGFTPDPPESEHQRSFNYNLYIGQPAPPTPATPYGSVPLSNVQIQNYNVAPPEAVSRASVNVAPTTSASILQPTSYYVKTTTVPPPRISFVSTTPASPFQDITVVSASQLQASLNPYGAKKATAIDPAGNYEYGNTAPSSTYATNYDYDYDGGYKIADQLSSTEATNINSLDSNRVALYYQAAQ